MFALLTTLVLGEASSSSDFDLVMQRMARYEAQLVRYEAENDALRERVRLLEERDVEEPTRKIPVAAGSGSTGRRLSSSSTFLNVPMWSVHEFTGNSCPSPPSATDSGVRALIPAGSTAGHPSPTSSTAELSLAGVATDWATSTIQTFASPLKVVHDSDCAAPPSLALQLNTTVEGLDVTGALTFTQKGIGFDNLRARFAGGEIRPSGGTLPDGTIRIQVAGTASAQGLRETAPAGSAIAAVARAPSDCTSRSESAPSGA